MIERFWANVRKTSLCWHWTGCIQKSNGYGVISESGKRGKRWYAHRYAYTISHGPIPSGSYVCHRCDNPACVNPDHLFLGDGRVNMRDASTKNRLVHGERHHSARLTAEMVMEVRARYAAGGCTYKGLAREYGVFDQAIKHAIIGKTWARVPFPPYD